MKRAWSQGESLRRQAQAGAGSKALARYGGSLRVVVIVVILQGTGSMALALLYDSL